MSVKKTFLILLFCLSILAGLGLAKIGLRISLVLGPIFGAVSIVMLKKRTIRTVVWVVLFGISLGWWRGGIYQQRLEVYQPLYYHKISLSAVAMNDGVYSKSHQLSFDANNLVLFDGEHLTGKIAVSGFGLPAIFEGDRVEVTGKLYPSLGSYQGRMSFALLHVSGHHSSIISDIRRKFVAGMQSALPEPLASFAMGLLIGQRATLPPEVKQDLLMVGLTHIIAVSGYNMTIMLRASKGILAKRSKRLSTLLSFTLIGIFLLLAGSSASIIRAAIVSTLSIMAGYYGRSFKPLNLIMIAAALTAWANPVYIWSDASWYLSFLAFYGVMILAPIISARFRPRLRDSILLMVALESLCAEIMTIPYVLHVFGQISSIGLLANVLVVALIPMAMLLSLAAGLAGMFWAPFAGWLAWPARILLTYMLDIAHILANIPHVFVQNIGLGTFQMLVLYVVSLMMIFLLWFKNKSRSATITDRT